MSSVPPIEPVLDVQDDDETPTGRKQDDELKLLGSMLRQLSALDELARVRVMQYLSSRFAKETR